jgi:hypothetical protein
MISAEWERAVEGMDAVCPGNSEAADSARESAINQLHV